MNEPLIHVLIINWNGRAHLEECYASLLASPYENVRYVLVDNASTDDSVAYVEGAFGADPRVEVLRLPQNIGWGGGNNVGIRRALDAGADYVFLLNNDTRTDAAALERLVAHAEATPQAGAWAPKMLLHSHPRLLNSLGLELSIIGASWDRGIGRLDGPRWDVSTPVPGVCGGACFLRAEALRKTKLLPERFGIYLDDLDLCLQLWEVGYQVLTSPEARIWHKFSATVGQGKGARRKYYLNNRNRMWLMARHFPAQRMPEAMASFAVGEGRALGRAVLDKQWWRVGAHAQSYLSAAGYLPQALRERQKGVASDPPFWPYLNRKDMFCPGFVLPEQGWYPAVKTPAGGGNEVRPISDEAVLRVPTGELRVRLANLYPHVGPAEVAICVGNEEVAVLRTETQETWSGEAPEGMLRFKARRFFSAEDTGALYDCGGWLAVEDAAGKRLDVNIGAGSGEDQ